MSMRSVIKGEHIWPRQEALIDPSQQYLISRWGSALLECTSPEWCREQVLVPCAQVFHIVACSHAQHPSPAGSCLPLVPPYRCSCKTCQQSLLLEYQQLPGTRM